MLRSLFFMLLFLQLSGLNALPPTLRVTEISTAVTPAKFSGKCPASFVFAAKVTVNAKGRIKYRWIQSDGYKGPVEVMNFTAAGSQVITANWSVGEPGKSYSNLWKTIEILSPHRQTAEKKKITLLCADPVDSTLRGDIDVSDIALDQQCRIVITHTNRGGFRVNQMLREIVWINGNVANDSTEVIKLEPGESQRHTVGVDLGMKIPTGATVRVMIDVDNELIELNEVNNILSKRLRCPEKEL